MESVNEIKEALSARSRTATLDELRSEGRKRVRLIRAEHVAAMISEAVHAAIEQTGLLAPGEVEKLVEKSRQEFRSILSEREQEAQRAQDIEDALAQREGELAAARARSAELETAAAQLRRDLEARNTEVTQLRTSAAKSATGADTSSAREQELSELKRRFSELSQSLIALRAELESTRGDLMTSQEAAMRAEARAEALAARPLLAAAAPPSANNELLLSLMNEMAAMRAGLMRQPAPVAPAAPAPLPDFSAAIDRLAGTLNDRLETLGKRMGVSAAVEGSSQVDFGGLFRDADQSLESNIDTIQVKQQTGGGIAANLARLKKLKGGG